MGQMWHTHVRQSVEDSPLENKTALEENNHQRLTDAVCSLSSALGNVAVLRKGPVDIMAVGVEGIGFSVHLPAMLLC